MAVEILTLQADGWTATVAPSIGGAITSLDWKGHAILRPTPYEAIEAGDVRRTACYPLVPYANRIANGRFRFEGADHQLAADFPGSPHSLHGVGWQRPWTVIAADARSCHLALEHRPGAGEDWPFAFDAQQNIAVIPNGLTLRLSITNTGEVEAPAGLGFHPFFQRRPGERLTFQSTGALLNGPDMLPVDPETGERWDYANSRPLDQAEIDNDFIGWGGQARLDSANGPCIGMAASSIFQTLRLFTPPGRDFYAVEPVSHRTNAVNDPDVPGDAMTVLAPGSTMEGTFQIDVRADMP